ncbi:serine/arginine-rich splicing factor SR34A-like [Teleopsis dalmanni]|uniref:serine/arginine-rich splicing factor SR34A-like n=1 Tax=Teleopsis dalmanni TaxID=139649 RepID=UPI0018CDC84A|nr:serine/arginine-rich splicing factor SR34A-like [Teleopsis dalmanni]
MPMWDIACKVYVGNLGNSGSKAKFKEAFSVYGPLRNIWVARKPAGFAFIEFQYPHHAKNAVRALNGALYCGTQLRVEMATGRTRWDDYRRNGFGGSPNDGPYVGGGWFNLGGGGQYVGGRWLHGVRGEHHYCKKCRYAVGGWHRYGEDKTHLGDKMLQITDDRRCLGGERLYTSGNGPSVSGRKLQVSYAGPRLGVKQHRSSKDGHLIAYDRHNACENNSCAHCKVVRVNDDMYSYSDDGRHANWLRPSGFHSNENVVYADGNEYRSLDSGHYRNFAAKTKSTNQNLVLQLSKKQVSSAQQVYRPILPHRRRNYPRTSPGDKRAQSNAQGRY